MAKRAALRIGILPAILAAIVSSPTTGRAQDSRIRVQADLEYNLSDIDSKNRQTGDTTATEYSYFKQKYDVELQTRLFPYLSVHGGGLFQLIDSNATTKAPDPDTGISETTKSGFDQTATRYFGEVNLRTPLYSAGTAYRWREFELDRIGVPATTLNREEISGIWKWRPVGLPQLGLDFNRFRTWDDEKTRNQVVGLVIVKARYDYEGFSSDYTYTRSDEDERIRDFGSLTQVHNGGVRYTESFFGDRLQVTGAARYNYDTLDPSGTGDIERPTSSPGSEFYLLDDSDPSTLTVVDAANPLTNVNIGRDGPMNDVAVGLDFGPPTEVDTIYVLPLEDQTRPDLATPADIEAIAGSFVWRAFISDDQINWREQTVTSATYDVFDNRFEISFSPDADAQFVKLVTTPIFDATKRIELADLRSFTTIPATPGLSLDSFTQSYNVGLRWAATPDTTASFESFARLQESGPFNEDRNTFTNGVSVQHDFAPWLYGDARVQRTDNLESQRPDSARHGYSASLSAELLPTLDQRLIYSGSHEQEGGLSAYSNSIYLRTNADLYRDWSVTLDLGYSARTPIRGADSTNASLRLSTNFAPNRKMNFTIDYLGSYQTQDDLGSGFDQTARFQVFWVPLRTLSAFARVDLRDDWRDERGLRVAQNYAVNWSPLLDGRLRFNLAYNQTIDTEGNEVRSLTPRIEWQILRNSLLTVSFDYGTIETGTQKSDLRVLRTNFRTFY